ncbi:MAG: ATPase domain-containing protein [Candidatus Woesearchaeota archaeon]
MTRVKTGIQGFDKLVEGGFPKGSAILYTGTPGTGKTIFGLEFLINGCVKFKEKGLFVTFEEGRDDILRQSEQFSWNLLALEKIGMFTMWNIQAKNISRKTSQDIIEFCKKNKVKRLVVDSLSTLAVNAPVFTVAEELSVSEVMNEKTFISPPIVGDVIIKRFIYNFIADLKSLKDTVSLLISENSVHSEFLSRDTISEFLCDGVIVVTFESLGGEYSRSLLVRKMRQTNNDEDIHPLEISKTGIVIHDIK